MHVQRGGGGVFIQYIRLLVYHDYNAIKLTAQTTLNFFCSNAEQFYYVNLLLTIYLYTEIYNN